MFCPCLEHAHAPVGVYEGRSFRKTLTNCASPSRPKGLLARCRVHGRTLLICSGNGWENYGIISLPVEWQRADRFVGAVLNIEVVYQERL